MSSGQNNPYIEFGKSGGSTGQPYETRRGLGKEQPDPLVLWWVGKLKAEYSADGKIQTSYRRSRWGHPAEKRVSPIQPFFTLHKDGRLLSNLFLSAVAAVGLIASLNVVALADNESSVWQKQDETAVHAKEKTEGLRRAEGLSKAEIPFAMRFSMMKDFVGQHNQYLDLSKLNEFKWSDDIKLAARPIAQNRQMMSVFTSTNGKRLTQPQAVRSEKMSKSNGGIYDAKLRGGDASTAASAENSSVQAVETRSFDQCETKSGDKSNTRSIGASGD